jgi:hypothetical protein
MALIDIQYAGGTGSRFGKVVIILTGVSALFATLVTVV